MQSFLEIGENLISEGSSRNEEVKETLNNSHIDHVHEINNYGTVFCLCFVI